MKLTCLLLLVFVNLFAGAEPYQVSKKDTIIETHNKDFVYYVKKATLDIHIDGVLDEADWQLAQKADNFYLVLPVDTGFPNRNQK